MARLHIEVCILLGLGKVLISLLCDNICPSHFLALQENSKTNFSFEEKMLIFQQLDNYTV